MQADAIRTMDPIDHSQPHLGDSARNDHSLLLVDDDPNVIGVLGKTLKEFGRLRFATSGLDTLRMAQQAKPDLILLDIEMPGMGGFDVCRAMKANPLLADVPIIFITSHDSGEHEVTGLALGASDFICKPLRPARVVARVRMHLQMKQMSDALRRSAYTDALTGIANRRQFDDVVHREWRRAQRTARPLSLLMIDIDAFKKYNDHYGHPAGDACLKAVAMAVQQAAHRPGDLAARFGGEEFAVILPDTDVPGACHVALHLLDIMDDMAIAHAASPVTRHVTLSIGVSAFDDSCGDWVTKPTDSRYGNLGQHRPHTDLIQAADKALYAAKQAGRSQAMYLGLDDLEAPALAAHIRPARGGSLARLPTKATQGE